MSLTDAPSTRPVALDAGILTGPTRTPPAAWLVTEATEAQRHDFAALRREVFVGEQGLFHHHDHDDLDDDPRTVVLVATDRQGELLGGVRLGPAVRDADLGWWAGSRLAVTPRARGAGGIGVALVRAACARAESAGVLRFDAMVQTQNEPLFHRLGWKRVGAVDAHGVPHVRMTWPVGRIEALARATKAPLGSLLGVLRTLTGPAWASGLGGDGFIGDDAAPVPGSDLVAACDAIVPSMVERDPEWAGWCAVLVNVNDVLAMGAVPVGLLDAVGGRDAAAVRRVLSGIGAAAEAFGLPILGGHTQLGVPAALSATVLGRTSQPVPGGGGQVGHALRLTVDLGGGWRPNYTGAQWDSSSHRTAEQLRSLCEVVPGLRPHAAKDVSMAGVVGTVGMLAEASGCGAVIDVAQVPRPSAATMGDWLTCFPGFGMVTAEHELPASQPPAFLASARCGELVERAGVGLRWPDGFVTEALAGPVTGLGAA